MRILHTSDWHLGDHLGRIDRTDDQLRAIDRVLAYCDEQRVDVLLVAGDLFDAYHGATFSILVRSLAERLTPRLEAGLRAICIAGNHDREHIFRLVETIQQLSGAETLRQFNFVGGRRILTLNDPHGNFPVQFVLMPYPTIERYLPDDLGVRGLAAAERRQALARAFAQRLAHAQDTVDPNHPAVLAAHIYVRTSETSTLFRMSEADDVPIEPQDLPSWAYVALGHIHREQPVGGRPAVRYSGSIERLDLGESEDQKSCTLVEIGPAGLLGEPVLLPLDATPIYTVEVRDGDAIETLPDRYPDHARALVNLQVVWRPGEDNPSALVSQLSRIFPRCVKLSIRPATEPTIGHRLDADPRDLGGTVRTFLEQRLASHSRRQVLLDLASNLVEEVQSAAAAD